MAIVDLMPRIAISLVILVGRGKLNSGETLKYSKNGSPETTYVLSQGL
jgi:hypothetical protein